MQKKTEERKQNKIAACISAILMSAATFGPPLSFVQKVYAAEEDVYSAPASGTGSSALSALIILEIIALSIIIVVAAVAFAEVFLKKKTPVRKSPDDSARHAEKTKIETKSRKTTHLKVIVVCELVVLSFFMGRITMLTDPSTDQEPPVSEIEEITDVKEINRVAKNYLKASPFSKQGLIETLCTYEHFERGATEAVVESLSVDWEEQAVKEVEAYLYMEGNPEGRIREFLMRDLFTEEQIDKAIEKADPDWAGQARRRADVLREAGAEEISIKPTLYSIGFTEEQINEALHE